MNKRSFIIALTIGSVAMLALSRGARGLADSSSGDADPCQPVEGREGFILAAPEDKACYLAGYEVVRGLKHFFPGLELRRQMLLRGIDDALAGREYFTAEQATQMQQQVRAYTEAARRREAEAFRQKNLQALHQHRQQTDVQVTASGLQYRIIRAGCGPRPTADQTVALRYTVTLFDGTLVEKAGDEGPPVQMRVDSLLPGWTEALLLMPRGSRWELMLPPELAYGEQGAGRRVPPHAALLIDLELVGE